MGHLQVLTVDDQIGLWTDAATDTRGAVRLGWAQIDGALRRGGLPPSSLSILGGRTGTRKTTVTVNLIANMLSDGRAVAMIGLDEAPWQYTAKVVSAMMGIDAEWYEENWHSPEAQEARTAYLERARSLTLSKGSRPHPEALSAFLDMAEVGGRRPEVMFLDYTSLMYRGRGRDVERIPNLIEDLKVWVNKEGLALVLLHQIGRLENRYEGDMPVKLADLMYGGEQQVDIVFGTWRPALDPIGNMTQSEAQAHLGDKYDEDAYWAHVQRVKKYANSTFFQVIKNRPGKFPDAKLRHGVELLSPNESMRLEPAERSVDDAMRLEAVE